MRYLGLDLSTVSTGWAIFEERDLIKYGKVCPPFSDVMARTMITADEIRQIVSRERPNKIIIEDTYYGSNYDTTVILNRLAGAVYYAVMTLSVYSPPIDISFVKPSSARKHMGLLPKSPEEKKRPSKSLIVSAVNAKFGTDFRLKDNDITDAIVMGYYGYIQDHEPDESFKKTDQKFFKTGLKMGVRTKKMKGIIDG